MKDQNCTIETLAAKAAAYNRGGNHLAGCLYEIRRNLEDILPENFHFTSGSVGYTSNLKDSNVGYYGEALCYVPEYDAYSENRSEWKPVEQEGWDNAGGGYYLHDDFHKWIDIPTRTELKTIAKEMPAFIEALAKHLAEEEEDNQEATVVLMRMLEACKTSEASRE